MRRVAVFSGVDIAQRGQPSAALDHSIWHTTDNMRRGDMPTGPAQRQYTNWGKRAYESTVMPYDIPRTGDVLDHAIEDSLRQSQISRPVAGVGPRTAFYGLGDGMSPSSAASLSTLGWLSVSTALLVGSALTSSSMHDKNRRPFLRPAAGGLVCGVATYALIAIYQKNAGKQF